MIGDPRETPDPALALLVEASLAIGSAEDIATALDRTLEIFCRRAGWPLGEAWVPTARGTLMPASIWLDDAELKPFVDATRAGIEFGRGDGLPGSVWEAGRSRWLPDAGTDPAFVRAAEAREVGLHAAFAVPVSADDEVVAVLVFFLREVHPRDEEVTSIVEAASVQLGTVIARRRAAEALADSRERFTALVGAIDDHAIFTLDTDGSIATWNRGARSITGFAGDEILGGSLATFWPEGDDPPMTAVAAALDDARKEGSCRAEGWRLRSDGTRFWASVTITSFTRDDGTLQGYSVVMRDLTGQKRAEQLRDVYEAELRRSNEDLERFASVASHDLQEPLRQIAGFTQLLARRFEGRLDEDADEFIGYVLKGVERMQELIDDLLEYSRVGTRGRTASPVDLSELIAEIEHDMPLEVQELGVTIEQEGLPVVFGDRSQLRQLFSNLIGNAIKYRGDEPLIVRLGGQRDGDGWEIAVTDNGIGIEPRFADQVFEIFKRLHPRDQYPGTGIGLAICKRIVERHGGRIVIRPKEGSGTTFVVWFPDAPPVPSLPSDHLEEDG